MDTTYKKLPSKPVDVKKRITHWLIAIVSIVLIVWSCTGTDFGGIKASAAQIAGAIFSGIFHPDWSYVYNGTGEDLISQLWQTICIAFLGTFISAIISLPFAFWAANTRHKKWYASRSGKIVLAIIRSFPEIVLALMFIKAVGPGSAAGVLALGFHSVGMLAKLFSEAIENLEDGPNEAVTSVGGSKFNIIMFSTMPNLMPALISNTLYRFDVSIRSASILGLVGAGGIGYPLIIALQYRQWNRVGIILLGIIVMVVVIDWISGWIRKKLV
ncbi:phosphonate ABC transporter, permease protein PhnE [Lactobacillus hamsteri]|uniref:Abc-type phosphate phosphonate transport system, permease component n=1 Tax=Lactobacillus hamsteri DSM 5661 = JCM 6256 TaxID=1423754 RepID=A0A0R1YJL8_9LACO|nr:phosphonate ABC transporter, permease protein PhnE [Lactobacillus hamsteri]KRM39443.1 abc-type phosphate phosphonate transport system, permease component [Lactobacillus hamsteri DSM 5661 = JCM 6256]